MILLSSAWLDARTWTNRDGNTLDGELVSVNDHMVVIRRDSDQRLFELPIDQFSAPDQALIQAAQLAGDPPGSAKLTSVALVRLGFLALMIIMATMLGNRFDIRPWSAWRCILWYLLYGFTTGVLFTLVGVAVYFAFPEINWLDDPYRALAALMTRPNYHLAHYSIIGVVLLLTAIPAAKFLGLGYGKAVLFIIVFNISNGLCYWLSLICVSWILSSGVVAEPTP